MASVVKWNGSNWIQPTQTQPNDEVWALTTFHGQVVAGGLFTSPGSHVSIFDGTAWQPLGLGLNGSVYALCTFDPDGPGPSPELLIAGGTFTVAGDQAASCVAAWDGQSWSALGAGTTGKVRALTVWNNQLVVAGDFFSAGGLVSPGMAFWGCPQPPPCYPNCDASTIAPILNVNDFQCFLNLFANGNGEANCDGSAVPPILNVNDFQCFINRFAAGCS